MTEAELCAEFMAWARSKGHRCYPEWAGWDILLVREDGTQVGIEAKTRANVTVLRQALSPRLERRGPHYHAVLVPLASQDFKDIARELQLRVLEWTPKPSWPGQPIRRPTIPRPNDHSGWSHPSRPDLPPVEELEKPAGVPSPGGLTDWKLKAIRLCILLERQGYVTTKDFKALELSPTFWVDRWIRWDGTKLGRLHRYVAIENPRDPRPDTQHPEATAALREA